MSARHLSTTARLDPNIGAWVLAESPVGPAGAVDVEVAGGVVLQVDASDPLRIIALVAALPERNQTRALEPEVVAAVTAIVGPELAGPLTAPIGAESRRRTAFNLAVDPATEVQRRLLGRLALLDAIRTEDTPASAWWAAEAALLCARADTRLGLSERAGAEARAAAAWLAGLDAQTMPPGVPVDRITEVIAAVAARVASEDEPLARRLRLLGAELSSRPRLPSLSDESVDLAFDLLLGREGLSKEVALRSRLREVRKPDSLVVEGTFHLGGWLLDEGGLHASAIAIPGTGHFIWNRDVTSHRVPVGPAPSRTFSPAQMLVRIPLHSGGDEAGLRSHWLRVYELETGDLVATCPLRVEDDLPGVAVATLAIPAHYDAEQLAIDVTTFPMTAPDGSSLRAIKQAKKLALCAGDAERMGWFGNARGHWELSAELWATVGDADRRAICLAFAAQDAAWDGDPTAAKALLASAHAENCLWAQGLLDVPREVAAAFVAETAGLDTWLP